MDWDTFMAICAAVVFSAGVIYLLWYTEEK